jgi:hypothetical protein
MTNPTYCPACGTYMLPFLPPMSSPSERHTRCARCGYRCTTASWAEPVDDDPTPACRLAAE